MDVNSLKVAMSAMDFKVDSAELKKIIQEYDKEESGSIQYAQFVEIMTKKVNQRDPKEELQKAFEIFDSGKSGKISFTDLKKIAKELGENMTDEEI